MPSPRPTPTIRPQSPLSPRYDSPSRFENLTPPSPRLLQAAQRTGNSQRRANISSLRLPPLPRFHPANFPPSNKSSAQTTPNENSLEQLSSPHPQLAPRLVSDAQRHLLAYQRDTISAARASSPSQVDDPESPRLAPLGSPGPVTPLELEGHGEYLMGWPRRSDGSTAGQQELVEKLSREESARLATGRSIDRPRSR